MKRTHRFFLIGILLIVTIVLSCAGTADWIADSGDASMGAPPSATEESKPSKVAEPTDSGAVREAEGAEKPEIEFASEETAEKSGESIKSAIDRSTVGSRGASVSGLKAGFADDNQQFNYFLSFLEEYGTVAHYELGTPERIMLKIKDVQGNSLPNASVSVYSNSQLLVSGKSYSDGTFLFFPGEFGTIQKEYNVVTTTLQTEGRISLSRNGSRTVDLSLPVLRPTYQNVPLDIVFILDTTGSMGEEIERLKTTIDIINLNLISLSSQPKVRFGMILYKDQGDEEYVTRMVPLTDDIEKFRKELSLVYADGGGDTPEDLQSALREAVTNIQWNNTGIRLGFIITDAPPHLYRNQVEITYAHAAREANRKAIKLFSVGTGGLDLMGEYILRQISQYTYGKYIFLTYGDTGESEGGRPGSVSHHTGANYQTDRLETIIIRFAKEELSHLTDQPLEEGEDYFQAIKIDEETKEETLGKLFEGSLSQLVDFSAYRIEEGTPTAILPILAAQEDLALNAEYLHDHLTLSLATNLHFHGVERKDFQKILDELEIALSDVSENAPRVGILLGADLLISGNLYKRESIYELFLKLLRVETGEILSVSQAKIDLSLGI